MSFNDGMRLLSKGLLYSMALGWMALACSCVMEKDSGKDGTELVILLPDSLRLADSALVFLDDPLGDALDTLWRGVPPSEMKIRARTHRYAGGEAIMTLRGYSGGEAFFESYMRLNLAKGIVEKAPEADPPAIRINFPADQAEGMDKCILLRWTVSGLGAKRNWHARLYLGASNPPPLFADFIADTMHTVDSLWPGATYYWQLESVLGFKTIKGRLHSFTTHKGAPDFFMYESPVQFVVGKPKGISTNYGSPDESVRFKISPALPESLGLDSMTGTISGAVMDVHPEREYLVTAWNAYGFSEAALRIQGVAAREHLAGYWEFDGAYEDSTSYSVADVSGAGNTGSFLGNPKQDSGVVGTSTRFDGRTFMFLNYYAPEHNSTRYTISAWIKTGETDAMQTLVSRQSPMGKPYNLLMQISGGDSGKGIPPGRLTVAYRKDTGPDTNFVFGATTITDGKWHHVAGVLSDEELRVYVDGKRDGTRAVEKAPESMSSEAMLVGATRFGALGFPYPDAASFFLGSMDELRFYDFPLPDSSIALEFREAGWIGE